MNRQKRDGHEQAIDDNLKKVFNETLEEGIPDRFKNLLSQLKQQDSDQGQPK